MQFGKMFKQYTAILLILNNIHHPTLSSDDCQYLLLVIYILPTKARFNRRTSDIIEVQMFVQLLIFFTIKIRSLHILIMTIKWKDIQWQRYFFFKSISKYLLYNYKKWTIWFLYTTRCRRFLCVLIDVHLMSWIS